MADPAPTSPAVLSVAYPYRITEDGYRALRWERDYDPVRHGLEVLLGNGAALILAFISAQVIGDVIGLDFAERGALCGVLLVAAVTGHAWASLGRQAQIGRRRVEANHALCGSATVSLSADALHISCAGFDSNVAWPAVDGLWISRGHVMVSYLTGGGRLIIPTSCFEDEGAARAFLAAAESFKAGAAASAP